MPTSIITLVSNAIGAFKEFFGFQSKKLDLKNTQAMQQAKVQQNEQDVKDEINTAIANKDVNEAGKLIS